jgi:hypothetical protein
MAARESRRMPASGSVAIAQEDDAVGEATLVQQLELDAGVGWEARRATTYCNPGSSSSPLALSHEGAGT